MGRIVVTLHAIRQTNFNTFRSLLHQKITASQNVYLSHTQEKKKDNPRETLNRNRIEKTEFTGKIFVDFSTYLHNFHSP